jgi:hypothetical protein
VVRNRNLSDMGIGVMVEERLTFKKKQKNPSTLHTPLKTWSHRAIYVAAVEPLWCCGYQFSKSRFHRHCKYLFQILSQTCSIAFPYSLPIFDANHHSLQSLVSKSMALDTIFLEKGKMYIYKIK